MSSAVSAAAPVPAPAATVRTAIAPPVSPPTPVGGGAASAVVIPPPATAPAAVPRVSLLTQMHAGAAAYATYVQAQAQGMHRSFTLRVFAFFTMCWTFITTSAFYRQTRRVLRCVTYPIRWLIHQFAVLRAIVQTFTSIPPNYRFAFYTFFFYAIGLSNPTWTVTIISAQYIVRYLWSRAVAGEVKSYLKAIALWTLAEMFATCCGEYGLTDVLLRKRIGRPKLSYAVVRLCCSENWVHSIIEFFIIRYNGASRIVTLAKHYVDYKDKEHKPVSALMRFLSEIPPAPRGYPHPRNQPRVMFSDYQFDTCELTYIQQICPSLSFLFDSVQDNDSDLMLALLATPMMCWDKLFEQVEHAFLVPEFEMNQQPKSLRRSGIDTAIAFTHRGYEAIRSRFTRHLHSQRQSKAEMSGQHARAEANGHRTALAWSQEFGEYEDTRDDVGRNTSHYDQFAVPEPVHEEDAPEEEEPDFPFEYDPTLPFHMQPHFLSARHDTKEAEWESRRVRFEALTNAAYERFNSTKGNYVRKVTVKNLTTGHTSEATCALLDRHITFPGDLFVPVDGDGQVMMPCSGGELWEKIKNSYSITIAGQTFTTDYRSFQVLVAGRMIGDKLPFLVRIPLVGMHNAKAISSLFDPNLKFAPPPQLVQAYHVKLTPETSHDMQQVSKFALPLTNNGMLIGQYSTMKGDCGSILVSGLARNQVIGMHALAVYGGQDKVRNMAILMPKTRDATWISYYESTLVGQEVGRHNIEKQSLSLRLKLLAGFINNSVRSFFLSRSLVEEVKSHRNTDSKCLAFNADEGEVWLEPSGLQVTASAMVGIKFKDPAAGVPLKTLNAIMFDRKFPSRGSMVQADIDRALELAVQYSRTQGTPGNRDPHSCGYVVKGLKRKCDALDDPDVCAKAVAVAKSIIQSILKGTPHMHYASVFGKREFISVKKITRTITEEKGGVSQCRTIQSFELPEHLACVALMIDSEGVPLDQYLAEKCYPGPSPFLLGTNINGDNFKEAVLHDFNGGVEIDVQEWDHSLSANHIIWFWLKVARVFGHSEAVGMAMADTFCRCGWASEGKQVEPTGYWWPTGMWPTLSGNSIIHDAIIGGFQITRKAGQEPATCTRYVVQGDDALLKGLTTEETKECYSKHKLPLKYVKDCVEECGIVGRTFNFKDKTMKESDRGKHRAEAKGSLSQTHTVDDVVVSDVVQAVDVVPIVKAKPVSNLPSVDVKQKPVPDVEPSGSRRRNKKKPAVSAGSSGPV